MFKEKKIINLIKSEIKKRDALYWIARQVLKIIYTPYIKLFINVRNPINYIYVTIKTLPVITRNLRIFMPIFICALLLKKRKVDKPGKTILMLTISQIEIDPRINKVAKSLASQGYTVKIICYKSQHSEVGEENPFPGVFYKRVPEGALPHWLALYYQETLLDAGTKEKYDYVHVNDFTTLIVGWLLARSKNVPLIYDAHEMWVENVEYSIKKSKYMPLARWKKIFLSAMEKRMVKDADIFISVSKSICEEYKRRFRLKKDVLLIPNYPELSMTKKNGLPSIRKACGLEKEKFIILYIGGVNPVRNIEGVINSLQYLPEDCVFVIQGPGARHHEVEYRDLAKTIGVEKRVFFMDAVGLDEVIEAASTADCGIVMLKNMGLNFYWFYPNKFFEYMLAGIPVAVSNFPDVTEHVNREKCGVTFDPANPESIAAAIKMLYDNQEERVQMGRRGKAGILEKYNWETVVKKLYKEYEKLYTERFSISVQR